MRERERETEREGERERERYIYIHMHICMYINLCICRGLIGEWKRTLQLLYYSAFTKNGVCRDDEE